MVFSSKLNQVGDLGPMGKKICSTLLNKREYLGNICFLQNEQLLIFKLMFTEYSYQHFLDLHI